MDKWFFDNKNIQVFQKHFYCILFFLKGPMAPKMLEITFKLTKKPFLYRLPFYWTSYGYSHNLGTQKRMSHCKGFQFTKLNYGISFFSYYLFISKSSMSFISCNKPKDMVQFFNLVKTLMSLRFLKSKF